ncbi:hypothetical protein V9T40_003558 [Parthenolecanium corni]|uniref:Box C/D snoRNA protein 1 n=1 Tax=Parthenolecanium corni TaxID=536013 RepID=A0AAN9Y9U2_9HEMI
MEVSKCSESIQPTATVTGDREKEIDGRLGNCEVCDAEVSKYTCPRCEVKTCSLSCVKIHKFELECSGIRDRTAFKSMKKFSNLDLLSDYRFLEDIARTTLKYRKDINKRYTRFNTALPVQLFKLKRAAYSRGVRLLYLPQNFSKHRENSTYFEWKSNKFYWRIEWTFFTDSGIKKIVDERVLDTEKLGKVISQHLDPKIRDPELEPYYSAGFNGVVLLLKCEKADDKFFELDACSSVRANFRNKTIIEYPSIRVVLKHRKDEYELIDPDDERESQSFGNKDDVNQNEIEIIENDCDSSSVIVIS